MPFKVGTFTPLTTVGPQSITDVGFRGTWLILTGMVFTDTGPTERTLYYTFGAATSWDSQGSYSTYTARISNRSDCKRAWNDSYVYARQSYDNYSWGAQARLTQFTDVGFDLYWDDGETTTPGAYVHYIVGDGECQFGVIDYPTSGGVTVTTPFEPSGGLLFGHIGFVDKNSSIDQSRTLMGVFSHDGGYGNIKQWSMHTGADDNRTTSQSFRYQNVEGDPPAVVTQSSASSSGFDFRIVGVTGNGFSLEPNISPTTARVTFYLVFGQDVEFDIGYEIAPNNTEPAAYSVTSKFAPDLAAIYNVQRPIDAVIGTSEIVNQSFYDGVNQAGDYMLHLDDRPYSTEFPIKMYADNDLAIYWDNGLGVQAVNANWDGLTATGFDLDFYLRDAANRYWGWWVTRDRPATPPATGGNIKTGSFTPNTVDGTTQEITVGFEPTWYILTGGAYDDTVATKRTLHYVFGATDGTRERCYAVRSEDSISPSVTHRFNGDTHVYQRLSSSPPALAAQARHDGFTATGFRLFWDDAEIADAAIQYIAGDGDVEVGTILFPESGDTRVATPFATQGGIIFGHTNEEDLNKGITSLRTAMGAFDKNLNQWAIHTGSQHNISTADTFRYQNPGGSVTSQSGYLTPPGFEFEVTAVDSTGFTLGPLASPAGIRRGFYIAFGDSFEFEVGNDLMNSTTVGGINEADYAVSFEPDLAAVFHIQGVASVEVSTNNIFGQSFYDGTQPEGLYVRDANGANPSNVYMFARNDTAIHMNDSSGVTLLSSNWKRLDANGFTLEYTTVDSSQRPFMWWALRHRDPAGTTVENILIQETAPGEGPSILIDGDALDVILIADAPVGTQDLQFAGTVGMLSGFDIEVQDEMQFAGTVGMRSGFDILQTQEMDFSGTVGMVSGFDFLAGSEMEFAGTVGMVSGFEVGIPTTAEFAGTVGMVSGFEMGVSARLEFSGTVGMVSGFDLEVAPQFDFSGTVGMVSGFRSDLKGEDLTLVGGDSSHFSRDGPRINAAVIDYLNCRSPLNTLNQAARRLTYIAVWTSGRLTRPVHPGGKTYIEWRADTSTSRSNLALGLIQSTNDLGSWTEYVGQQGTEDGFAQTGLGDGYNNGVAIPYSPDPAITDWLRIAFDDATGEMWMGNATEDTWFGGGAPNVGSPTFTISTAFEWWFAVTTGNAGGSVKINGGHEPFRGTVPSGYRSLGD